MYLPNSGDHTVNENSLESIHMVSVNDHADRERLLGSESRSSVDHSGSEDGGETELVHPNASHGGRQGGYEGSIKSVLLTWGQVKDIVVETAPTLLFTTVGLLFTGELLDHVSHWKAMTHVDELIIIIPVILNLKGNLEMNLSARLGTSANMGQLDDRRSRRDIVLGNLALLQVQATIVSFVAACLSFGLGLIAPRAHSPSVEETSADTATSVLSLLSRIPKRPKLSKGHLKSGFNEFVMVASTGIASACLSGLVLGSFMCSLVILCRRFNIDPDNIAPPIASCLGDLVTLCLLGLVSSVLINFLKTPFPLILVILLVLSACICTYFTLKNRHVRDLLWQGWTSLFGAMVISTASGLILDFFVSRYSGFALLAIVISGLPGAVGSVFVSRMSTMLHAEAASSLPSAIKDAMAKAHPSLRTVTITLFIITIPVEIIFLSVLRGIGWLTLPFAFVATSVIFFCATVIASLYVARMLTNWLWSKGRDPDLYALPIHSSIVDLLGQTLLVLCFELVSLFGGKVQAGSG